MFNHTHCPSCKAQEFKPFMTCEDHTVSHEQFPIVSCLSCGLKFTNPIPELSRLGDYYKSETYISHSDTRKGLMAKVYHVVRSYTLKQKLKLVQNYVSRGTILDYGCGTGMFLKVSQGAGWNALGMEPDTGARSLASSSGCKIYSGNEELEGEVPSGSLDAITLWHVLEHVTDLQTTLSLFKRSLKSKGVLIIALPNHKSHDALRYGPYWAAYDVPRHLYHFEPRTVSSLLGRYGFGLINTIPMKFDSFYVSMLSEKYRTGKLNYFSAVLEGIKSNQAAKTTGDYSSLIYVFKHQ